jgi:hypothetical protein
MRSARFPRLARAETHPTPRAGTAGLRFSPFVGKIPFFRRGQAPSAADVRDRVAALGKDFPKWA